jgi:hypothetical protein
MKAPNAAAQENFSMQETDFYIEKFEEKAVEKQQENFYLI